MQLVKRKTFEFDDQIASDFEEFCRARLLVEKRVVEAAVIHFMCLTAEERETAILSTERFAELSRDEAKKLALVQHLKAEATKPRIAASPRRPTKS